MCDIGIHVITEAIERSNSLWPQIDGLVEYISTDRYLLNFSDDRHHFSNRVSLAKLTEANAESTIHEIIDFYRKRKLDFIWVIGPNSTPGNLAQYLECNEFIPVSPSDGLYMSNLKEYNMAETDFRISEIPIVEDAATIRIMAEGFEMPMESSVKFHRTLFLMKEKIRLRTYAALMDGVDEPVGCAFSTYYPDLPIALLSGATTLPEFRGRGMYRALLQKRINDVIGDSIKAVIVMADQRSSAPICHKFGFTKACELFIYKYCFDENNRDE
ncbi:MAG: hypothetical protein R3F48_02795 [Candidatus Zixiibacteriota bacterium]